MKKSVLSLLLTASLSVALSCPAFAHESYILYFAEEDSEDSVAGMTAWMFADLVLAYTGHSLAVDVYTDGELGTHEECLENLMGDGDVVNFMRLAPSELKSLGVDDVSLLSLPYTFDSHEAFRDFTRGKGAEELLEAPEDAKSHMVGIGYMELGFFHTAFKDDVSSLAGYEGKTIAISGTDAMEDVVLSLGAVPASLPEDLESALSSGDIDAVEATLLSYDEAQLSSLASSLVLDRHRMDVYQIVMSAATWRILTRAERMAVRTAAQEAAAYNASLIEQREAMLIDALREAGVSIAEPESAPFKEAAQDAIDTAVGKSTKLYKKILDR